MQIKLRSILLVLCFMALYVAEVKAQIKEPFPTGMNNNMMLLSPKPNSKRDFEVTFKDGSKIIINSKINMDTVIHIDYLISKDKKLPDSLRNRKIHVNQTSSIATLKRIRYWNDDGKYVSRFEPDKIGLPNDSCWAFKAIEGKISIYSYISDGEESFYSSWNYVIGMQLDNGPIIKLTQENLMPLIGDDEELLREVKKKWFKTVINNLNHKAKALQKQQAKLNAKQPSN